MQRTFLSAAAAAVATTVFCASATFAQVQFLNTQPGAVDQPRINIAIARASTPTTPLQSEGFDLLGNPTNTISVEAYYDTGASGIVLGAGIADALGIQVSTFNGQPVVYSDVGAGGTVPFAVSEELIIYTADSLGILDGLDANRFAQLSDPNLFQPTGGIYNNAIGPARVQIGPVNPADLPDLGLGDLFSSDINVVGIPAMAGKTIVFDPRPTRGFDDFFDNPDPLGDPDALNIFMRTYSYDPGTAYNPAQLDSNPGIVPTNLHVALTYANFDDFVEITPAGAPGPLTAGNPFVGANPITGEGSNPGVEISLGSSSSTGSWLLDTGAAASFISTEQAGNLGVTYDPANGIGSENPLLLGVEPERQFTLTIQGIDGNPTNIAGFLADEMVLPTDEGIDMEFVGAPVLVLDIELQNAAGEMVTLDGILGMNFFVSSADYELDGFALNILDFQESPFEFFTFDQLNGKLGFQVAGLPIPEPTMLGLLAVAAPLVLRRRSA